MIVNEQIKASEVQLTGLNGENMGIVPRDEALALAKKLKVDLVCTSLMSSPPPCKLISRGAAKQSAIAEKRETSKKEQPMKVKEIRLTTHIEDHDYDTKLRQSEKLLSSGNAVELVVRIQGKEGPKAKELLERALKDLAAAGKKQTGIQVSGKQAVVRVLPL
ncbi:translation initiation factor IF-3 [Paenibacillus baekrokdamisoli]|uniref:Translation initiation factor IF-3 n=1 Tax=Paenibacillus baekrokdamisoli TaxID=1712516 RepID=A0A3G9JFN7_9BACL|nr:translation initiation factor IF-3 [Paenibacillus baekrokdamisoli]MBB3068088.1 translation initiation factor IF-3 [Paenibacillus baekrokdamisoli]BBH22868.1 translation initiation factor IF-3 [Paenibacillus baekrokdamisoli]